VYVAIEGKVEGALEKAGYQHDKQLHKQKTIEPQKSEIKMEMVTNNGIL
jgi:outer membrane translocation and assembly module TamA